MVVEEGSIEDWVKDLGAKVVQCLLQADTEALSNLLDEEFVLRLPDGERLHKDEWLQLLASGQARYKALSVERSALHVYDRQVAFLSGHLNLQKVYRGRGIIGRFPYTALYVCKNGTWRLVALHQIDRGEETTSAVI